MNRARIAHAAYWVAAGLFALTLCVSFFGGFELGALRVTSWRILRLIVAVGAVGFAVDPNRAETMRWAEAWLASRAVALWIAAGVAVLYATVFKVALHASFRTSAYDLSLYHHALENTLAGHFLHAFGIERNFFSEHASPILLLLLPLYAVARTPLTLLVVHGAGAAAAVIPLFALARREGASRLAAVGVAAAFFFNAFLWRGVAFDFHPEVLAPLGLFAAAWAYRAGRWPIFYACVVATLSLKEELGFVVACAAVFWGATGRNHLRHAAIACALGVAWAVVAFTVIIPASYPVAAERSHFIERYGHLGRTYLEVAIAFVVRPLYLAKLLVGTPALSFLASTGGMALLSPLALVVAAPLLVLHLASSDQDQADLLLYYAVPALGVVFIGIARGLARLELRYGGVAAVGAVALALAAMPSVPFVDRVSESDRAGAMWLKQLPPRARVSAQNSVLPHLDPSMMLWLFPDVERADWVVLDRARSKWPLEPPDYRVRVVELLQGGEFGVVQYDGRFILLRRGASRAVNDLVVFDLSREQ